MKARDNFTEESQGVPLHPKATGKQDYHVRSHDLLNFGYEMGAMDLEMKLLTVEDDYITSI